ncbi:NusG domain II-containing protein [Clostridium psychrophilum]|uniref:NusG domain II-containing protein n=1 Tax=Clostridium psychrophilum TaxID=132926 RepID=UPI001C0C8D40|nr:NusG domain II-containing protein [Clostridium psychrophilum]MBU3182876.1 NusG domain II-containing protein [Clostridium psychrophilum]
MKKGDKVVAILIIFLVLISGIGTFIYKQHIKSNHNFAVIKMDGKIIQTIDLNAVKSQKEWNIYTKTGDYNLIEILPGKIRIKDSDCPDKICVKEGWISQAGQILVCLPHKLIIKINGKNNTVDSVLN